MDYRGSLWSYVDGVVWFRVPNGCEGANKKKYRRYRLLFVADMHQGVKISLALFWCILYENCKLPCFWVTLAERDVQPYHKEFKVHESTVPCPSYSKIRLH